MNEEKLTEENIEENHEKKGIVVWAKKHKSQLIFVGIGVTTILVTTFGLKNKGTIIESWNSIKKAMDKGSLYSSKWFEKASIEELDIARKQVQQDYLNPNLNLDYRNDCWNLLKRFDNAIEKIRWAGKEYGYPVHSSNGWYLESDD